MLIGQTLEEGVDGTLIHVHHLGDLSHQFIAVHIPLAHGFQDNQFQNAFFELRIHNISPLTTILHLVLCNVKY